MITLDDELIKQYQVECNDDLSTIEAELLALEMGGTEIDAGRVGRAFRAVHSIKGGAIFLNLEPVRDLAKQMEDVLVLIRSRKVLLTPDTVSLLLRATDRLDELIQNPGASETAGVTKIVTDLAGLHAAGKRSSFPAGGTLPEDRRPRMLLVEDDFTSRLILQTFLSRYGECHVAVNGREALAAFRSALECEEGYDLICMDIMMPEMDGHEAVREMRAIEEANGVLPTFGARIIMTTSVGDVKEVILCFKELCDEYLMKPIDLAKLLGHLKSYKLVP